MPLSKNAFGKLVRSTAVVTAFAAALVGLVSQSFSTSAGTSAVDKDFIVLSQNAANSLDRSLSAKNTQVETLSDWEFTARVRPIKCRFVD